MIIFKELLQEIHPRPKPPSCDLSQGIMLFLTKSYNSTIDGQRCLR
jgi:hypothetical protein